MLGRLFGSNARVKILKLFLINPDKKYFIRQLSRDLKLQVNSVRRELDNLDKFGILVSGGGENTGVEAEEDEMIMSKEDVVRKKSLKKPKKEEVEKQEKKYYKANTKFILFEEIKSLIIKAQILYGQDFINKLKRAGNVKLLILAGKFVNQPDFPVDLFIVGRVNKIKLLRLIKELEQELGREINFALMDNKEFKYRREITDVFLYTIMEGKNIVALDRDSIM